MNLVQDKDWDLGQDKNWNLGQDPDSFTGDNKVLRISAKKSTQLAYELMHV